MNFIHIAGHLGADPEVRFTSTGKKVTALRVATRTRRGKNNDDTIWWRVTVWGEQFDKLISFLKKGSAVMVFGEIHKPELFNDRDGKPAISLEITATHLEFSPFGGKSGGQEGAAPSSAQSLPSNASHAPSGFAPIGSMATGLAQGKGETFDDEVPF